MRLPYRLLPCALLLVVACGDDGGKTTATPDTTTTTTATTTTSTTTSTTTGTTEAPTTTGTTTGTSSTTGEPVQCAQFDNEMECFGAGCDWTMVVGYTHGTQGCQGDIRPFCVPTDVSGGLTSVWKDDNGDIEVLQFGFTPTDLGPDWHVCDCDGPLACLCTAATLDCPERLEEFCSTITGENGCTNAAVSAELVCSWFGVSGEGPLDTMCDDAPKLDTCLPATKIGEMTCDPIALQYPSCVGYDGTPVFWRDKDGIIEVIATCGPEPVGWTKCSASDPNQPEECKCRC